MEENRVVRINRPNTWSVSRRQLLHKCPRAWALKYGFKRSNKPFNRHLQGISDWTSNWRMMQRTLRELIQSRLDSVKQNSNWIEKDVESKIKFIIKSKNQSRKRVLKVVEDRINKKSKLRSKISKDEVKRLVKICKFRFDKLMNIHPFSSIINGSIKNWHTFSRLEKTKFGKFSIHAAPDLAWFEDDKWHIARFCIQAKSKMTEQEEIENLSLLYWAVTKIGLPSNCERFVVHDISWRSGRWFHWVKNGFQEDLENSLKLITLDMKAMLDIFERLGPVCDLSQIPLAKNKQICKTCGHRDTCPGGQDLIRAKLEQESLELIKASRKSRAR